MVSLNADLVASFEASNAALNDFGPPPTDTPERRARERIIISVDDHLVEPPHMFEGRMPAKFADRTPMVVETEGGDEAWLLDGALMPKIGINAVVGRPPEESMFEPTRFEHMRRGAWDINARIADMDLDGVYASLNFPSLVGFAGVRVQANTDQEFALAVVRAWNQWHIEEWAGTAPDRIIPCQIPWLNDPHVAAAEVRTNAAAGFRALTFPESPDKLGFPTLHSGYWDPLMQACEETGTVVCLHTGSSGLPRIAVDAPAAMLGTIFGSGYAMMTAIEWLYSRIPVKFPDLKICLSEGGIGWVVCILDRLDHDTRKYGHVEHAKALWRPSDLTPSEIFLRNFWFCALDDPSSMPLQERIGVENLVIEVDYPHADTTWPDTQAHYRRQLAGLPHDDAERIAWRNAAELFRHPVPASVVADPNSF